MGHKVHPYGFRIGINKPWLAKWYADRDYATLLQEDMKIRTLVAKQLANASVSQVEIERGINHVTVTVHTAKPGIVIGKGGANVELLRNSIGKLTDKKVKLEIKEVLQPELDAVLVAQSIAGQLERRIAFRKAREAGRPAQHQGRGQGREDPGLGPPGRHRDVPSRVGQGRAHSPWHAACGHQLRRGPRPHHLRPYRGQGLDLPRRDARGSAGLSPHRAARSAQRDPCSAEVPCSSGCRGGIR